MIDRPDDPIAAVTDPDPYPYYADLVARRPFYRDDTLGMWIASSARAVTAVLSSDLCRVRPPSEPVPKALLGSPAGDIFGRLARMNDGTAHALLKPAVSAVTARFVTRAAEAAGRWARHLAEELEPETHPERVTDLAFRLPIYTLASLLGVAPDMLAETAAYVGDFVRCVAPGGTAEQLERGQAAASRLIAAFRGLPHSRNLEGDDTLLSALRREASRGGGGDEGAAIVANGIGFLSQAYEATAGLIGNTLVVLGRHADTRRHLEADRGALRSVIREVARYDPPVQNTRRFLARDAVVAGEAMRGGDGVLVIVAAANRDPYANPHPTRFDTLRGEPRSFTFGMGAHACPGEMIATTITEAAVERLMACGVRTESLMEAMTYRASANTRIPMFGPAVRG